MIRRRGKGRRVHPPLAERFAVSVDENGPTVRPELGPCHTWIGKRSAGYGWIRDGRIKLLAHRVSFELTNGPIVDGFLVMHECDNRGCVNPAHLRAGTHSQNLLDAYDRGRREKAPPGAERPCRECGSPAFYSRCNDCAKSRRDAAREASLAARGGRPAKMKCGNCMQPGHRRTNCTWSPTIRKAA